MSKKIKSILVMFLCISLVIGLYFNNDNVYVNASSGFENNDMFISKNLNLNYETMNQLFEYTSGALYNDSMLTVQISNDKKTVYLYLSIGGKYYGSVMTGTYNQVIDNGENGYIGVYEGVLPVIPGTDLALTSENTTPVIADITFSNSEMFVGLTLGYAADKKPSILFFGEFTETLSNFAAINYSNLTEKREIEKTKDDFCLNSDQLRADGTCRLKGYTSVNMGTNAAGGLSVFHANELKNQGLMSIYVKVNTNSNNVLSYIQNELGFGSSAVATYADTFNVSICGEHNNFHAVTNSYSPQNNSTSSIISIPVYLGSVLGVQFVSFNVTMSTTTVTPSRYSSSSPHPNNMLTWYIYKNFGWNPSDFDGDYTTSKGMTVASSYMYEGTVLGSLSRSVGSTGSIRYEYWAYIGMTQYQLHLTTGTMSTTTYVTVIP